MFICPLFAWAETTLEGNLRLRIVDNLNTPETTLRFLKSGTQNIQLEFQEGLDFATKLNKSGLGIQVSGEFLNEKLFSVTKFKVTSTPRIATAAVTGTRKIAVLITQFAGKPAVCSAPTLDGILYTNTNSMQKQYEVSSGNQLTFTRDGNSDGNADIFGPYTILESSGSCTNTDGWIDAARLAATTAGVNLSGYNHIFLSMPEPGTMGCDYGGLADLGGTGTLTGLVLNCSLRGTWSHEIGHNLGLQHASIDANNDGVIPISDEYSDASCPMGGTQNDVHFNAPHKEQLGWLEAYPGKVQNVTSTGVYNLASLETEISSSSTPMILKVQKNSTDYYYLSYRTARTIFSQINAPYVNKIQIHRFSPANPLHSKPTKFITSIGAGESWTDSALGLTVCGGAGSSTEIGLGIALQGAECVATTAGNASDLDGDGVSNTQEITDGSSAGDAGSYFSRLSSPTYTLWNGFLSMINILELINPSETDGLTVNLSLYDISGTLKHFMAIPLTAKSQRDIIINELPGFTADSYGIIKLEYAGSISGRTAYYRQVNGAYEFAYSVALDRSVRGKANVGFNTFQPSIDSADASHAVLNWLTIVNLSSSSKTFTINSYNQVGTKVAERGIAIPAFGRTDIDGGHGLVGPNFVGLHEIIPSDLSSDYSAQLIRYGTNGLGGYSFAFPLSAKPGNGEVQSVPISRQFGEDNWLELVNTTAETVSVTLQFARDEGIFSIKDYYLAAYSQTHLPIDSTILNFGKRGFVRITPRTPNSIVAQSMSYYRTFSGGIDAMFGISARELFGSSYSGSFNLFLGMENWLSLTNAGDATITATVSSSSTSGNGSTSVSLTAGQTKKIPIHSTAELLATPDTYGFIKVTPNVNDVLLTDIVRLKPLSEGVDFAFPTEMRGKLP